MHKKITNWFIKHMPVEDNIGLHENKAFRRWVGYPLLIILFLVIAITWDLYRTGIYSFSRGFLINSATLNDFAKFYAFPIAALAVPLTLGVMFNRFHSSKQKAKSNQLIEQNNKANNFFNHYKYFVEHCDAAEKRFEFKNLAIAKEVLYKLFFPKSSVDNFVTELNKDLIKEIIIHFRSIIEDYNSHLNLTTIDTVAQTINQGTSEEITHECYFLEDTFDYKLSYGGVYYQTSLKEVTNLETELLSSRAIIFMLLFFNGISNYREITRHFDNEFNTLLKEYNIKNQ